MMLTRTVALLLMTCLYLSQSLVAGDLVQPAGSAAPIHVESNASGQVAEPEDSSSASTRDGSLQDAAGVIPTYDADSYLQPTAVFTESPTGVCDGLACDALGCDSCDGTGCASGLGGCSLFSDTPLLDSLRGRKVGDSGWTYSVGGELRHRYMNEQNRLRPMGASTRDTYQLWRFTPFLEVGNEWIKGYVSAIDATSFGEDLPTLPIDENRWDLLQYYIDAKLLELDGGDVRGQVGRLFLKYGDQHLVSPLGWSNTFRNFEGGKLYYSGANWDIDGFVVRPNNGAASGSTHQPESFDAPDQSVLFSGVYATYKKARHGTVDYFWLWNDENEPSFSGPFGFNRQDGSRHTIGARYAGAVPVKNGNSVARTWNWDVLGGWQFGEDNFGALVNGNVSAGFLSAIGGVTLDDTTWKPSLKGVFWWGSGDSNPTDGKITTVNTLYPLGHAYWGLIDNFNGANLLDYSVQASVKPAKKVTLAAHMHWFEKASSNDYIYNIAGAPLGNTTTADRHIGNELDLLATYQVNANLQLQAGYFWFWYGDAVSNQGLRRDDAQQFYFMTTLGF